MSIKEAVEFYSDDLPNPGILDEELPLSSCACENSASVLRRLNTYLRCTQTEQRLSALALIHMNYEIEISVDDVCKTFLQKHPRKMEKANLLFD